MAQQVEHVLGKDEVTGSNPVISSKKQSTSSEVLCFLCLCPQDTTSFASSLATSFDLLVNIIVRIRTQNDVTPYGVNDVALRANLMLRIDFSPLLCYNTLREVML